MHTSVNRVVQTTEGSSTKILNYPISLGMNNVNPYNQSPSVGDHIPTLDGSHAFQPPKVQQDSKFLFRVSRPAKRDGL